MSTTISPTATNKDSAAGMVKLRLRLANDVLPQASNGPTPVKKTRNNPIGIVTLLKNGGPTLILYPRTASERMGKSAPQRIANGTANNTRLLNKKLDSRETSDSSFLSATRCFPLTLNSTKPTPNTIPHNLTTTT